MVRHVEMNENDSHKGRHFYSQFPRNGRHSTSCMTTCLEARGWSGGRGSKGDMGGKRTYENLLLFPQKGRVRQNKQVWDWLV